ncbi:hypothetical protein [Marinobacter sp. X15-166B]|uniref:hypothetical protein n=1 Tax=Marinobacter sp. X15-166B TaxID=1897620 RepID=UPI00085BC6C4|nr:hypothetical protein [Marinobacter sp. X15-166B]OEY67408.1 hypothetical protein BG841_13815 [Marinobacter sp. X15-166B]
MTRKHTPKITLLHSRTRALAALSQATRDWQQNSDVFTRLCRRLATTMSLETQLAIFAEELGGLVHFDRLCYQHHFGHHEFIYATGTGGPHTCKYRLTLEGVHYGDLSIQRRVRFADEELAAIEQLIGVLIFPVRNACRYGDIGVTASTGVVSHASPAGPLR